MNINQQPKETGNKLIPQNKKRAIHNLEGFYEFLTFID